ncbi:hypothetical protein OIU78_000080 [Salix suchowensis]|nr:hypothetical protein OIU78_000080 [Salix suchowensis]
MRDSMAFCASLVVLLLFLGNGVNCEDPYRFITWKITYGDIYPLGVKQQGILINGQFPGPQIDAVTNENLIISVYNYLREPFLISWKWKKTKEHDYGLDPIIIISSHALFYLIFFSWGTTSICLLGAFCHYDEGMAYSKEGTHGKMESMALAAQSHQEKTSLMLSKIWSRPRIPVPFPPPAGDFTVLAGDWYKRNHYQLRGILDGGHNLPFPDGLLINGRGWNGYTFTVDPGKTYRFRISNVGLTTSINFRIQGHKMKLVEVEGSHTLQNTYSDLDIHLGQSYSVLVTADQPVKDYYIVVSSRFTKPVLATTAILHYSNSWQRVSGPIPNGPTTQIDWSLNQARSIRWNLTASGPRPNPQGSYHYGMIKTSRTITLANSGPIINRKQRYAVNGVSFIPADTPLKVADYFNIPGVFSLGSMPSSPSWGNAYLQTAVMSANFREFIEIVFQNWEDTVQSWHIDGHSFFVVGMDGGQWTPASRARYNLRDTVARCTTQVYPKSWTAIYMALDNVGMWNIRSENWARQYLGQQFYLRVYSSAHSWRDELPIPKNALLCGRARGRRTRPL